MIAPLVDGRKLPSAELLKKIGYLDHVFVSSPSKDVVGSLSNYSVVADPNCTSQDLVQLLDAGAQYVVVSSLNSIADAPLERILLKITPSASPSDEKVAGYVVDFGSSPIDAKAFEALTKKTNASAAFFALSTVAPSIEALAALAKINVTAIVTTPALESTDLSDYLLAGLTSDRTDGLFPTVVTDEQGIALGLVYSSRESIKESIKTGQGVYQSRNRGLWYKGATSGDTQELLGISIDCDSDALKFRVRQYGKGFCHLERQSCFGTYNGVAALQCTLQDRKSNAPSGSYTARLFSDKALLHAKIIEEAQELCDATTKDDIAWEMADIIYFGLTKCIANGVSLADIDRQLDARAKKVTRRPGNAKVPLPQAPTEPVKEAVKREAPTKDFKMKTYDVSTLDRKSREKLLLRPVIDSGEMINKVKPIVDSVKQGGDKALLDFISKFDGQKLASPVLRAPFDPKMMAIDNETKAAIDQAYSNIQAFHAAQLETKSLSMETMPGIECSRFSRPIARVGLYVPGGTAVLPSTALMLGIPAQVAGCKSIVIASPPRKDGKPAPEVLYVAHKVGATAVLLAGGAQAIAAMAYGTESVPKVDKIFGPGNQWVTAAKMMVQNDTFSMTSIDMPAGPSEVLVIADKTAKPAYVAADLLSQAEHGVDSQVVLVAISLEAEHLAAIEKELAGQANQLTRSDIVRKCIAQSIIVKTKTLPEAIEFSNDYAPEHLILHLENAEASVASIDNAGSVFVGEWSPESCGDYASGTNHTLPTYGYARVYSGVNTQSYVKHITSQKLTKEGLNLLGDTVMKLAEVEGLDAHRNAVAVRLRDIRGLNGVRA